LDWKFNGKGWVVLIEDEKIFNRWEDRNVTGVGKNKV
jgi:hypothetical protein